MHTKIYRWMNDFLDSNVKETYAVIYGISKNTDSPFYGSNEYLQRETGDSESTVRRKLKLLVKMGLIRKTGQHPVYKTNLYQITYDPINCPGLFNENGYRLPYKVSLKTCEIISDVSKFRGVKMNGGGCQNETLDGCQNETQNNTIGKDSINTRKKIEKSLASLKRQPNLKLNEINKLSSEEYADLFPKCSALEKIVNAKGSAIKMNVRRMIGTQINFAESVFQETSDGGGSKMAKMLIEWLEHKREIKNMYKSKKGVATLYKNMIEASDRVVRDAIDRSIQNGYKGLFLNANNSKRAVLVKGIDGDIERSDWT